MSERWLAYEELAAAFGIGKESARTLVKRKRWPRKQGNDGLARIGVPEEFFETRIALRDDPQDDPPSDPPIDPQSVPQDDPPIIDPVITVLSRHIERLEGELEALKRERAADREKHEGELEALREAREAERLRVSQLEALHAVLEADRKRLEEARETGERRVEEWKAVADRFASRAEKLAERRSWWPWRRAG